MLISLRSSLPLAALLAPSLGLLAGTATAQTGLIGVGAGPGNVIYEIDPVTAVTTQIAMIPLGPNGSLGGLSQAPDGFLYGVTTGIGRLYRIDPSTFQATNLGNVGGTFGVLFEGGIAIGPDGTAYAANGPGGAVAAELLSIDLQQGSSSIIGQMSGGARDIGGLAMREDGMLIGVDRVANSVVEIDPVTAELNELAPFPATLGDTSGLVRSEGRWYVATGGTSPGSTGSNEIYELIDPYTGTASLVGMLSGDLPISGLAALSALTYGLTGTSYCAVQPNSLGVPAQIFGTGSAVAAANDLTLWATDLPESSFSIFLAGSASGFTANPGGSSGNLCLGGALGRFVAAGSVRNSGATRSVSLTIDLQQVPTDQGTVSIQAGDTYYFQAWYRDALNGGSTSNFSSGLEIAFQ